MIAMVACPPDCRCECPSLTLQTRYNDDGSIASVSVVGDAPSWTWLSAGLRENLEPRFTPTRPDLLEINPEVHYRIGEYMPAHDAYLIRREKV